MINLPANRFVSLIKYLLALGVLAGMVACGGGGAKGPDTGTPGGGGGGGGATSGTITLAGNTNKVSADSPSTLSATVKNSSGAAVPNTVVTFTTAGTDFAVFFPTGGTALTNASGVATITLQAGTIVGADAVSATATVDGTDITSAAFGFEVSAATVTGTPASISFETATPATIAIIGTGGVENASVTFRVKDSNGNPIKDQAVTFSLNTTSGGITLSTTTGISAADGSVSTTVRSGTIPTPVRVKATLTSNPIVNAISSQLVVSTAIPHQRGFSVAPQTLNIEAFNVDGVQSDITARLADRYGNLVPDNTAVSFRTEGGVSLAAPSCKTLNGACTISFQSAGLRPVDGRLTITATAVGEESFTDLNGNGLFDSGEPFDDLPEAFVDGNEDGAHQASEEFFDFNKNGGYSAADMFFNGVLRQAGAPGDQNIDVRQNIVIVLSTGSAIISTNLPQIDLGGCPNEAAVPPAAFTKPIQTASITVRDLNGNTMPAGTKIEFSATNGKVLNTTTSFNVPDSIGFGTTFNIVMQTDATVSTAKCSNTNDVGILNVKVTSPRGLISERSFFVKDDPLASFPP